MQQDRWVTWSLAVGPCALLHARTSVPQNERSCDTEGYVQMWTAERSDATVMSTPITKAASKGLPGRSIDRRIFPTLTFLWCSSVWKVSVLKSVICILCVCVCVCSSVTFHSISIIFDYSFKWSWGAISFSSLPLKLDTLTVSLNLFSILTCLLLKLIERNLQWIAGAYVAGCGCGGFFFFFFGRSWILICMVSYKSLTWGQRVAIRQEI